MRVLDILPKLLRFATVGGLSALTYLVGVWLLVSAGTVDPRLASVLAYLVSVPISFVGHRFHTFRSNGTITTEALKFILTHLIGILVMLGTMQLAVGVLSLPFWVGSLFGTLVVPALSFVVFDLWVFRAQRNERDPAEPVPSVDAEMRSYRNTRP